MARPRTLRTQKLIQPKLQLRLVLSFVGLAGLALLLQFLFLSQRLMSAVGQLEGPSGELADKLPGTLLQVLGVSLLGLLPIIFALGVLLTFRVAGPIYAFEKYFKAMARGEAVGPCRLREGDQLQSLCDVINDAVGPLQGGQVVAQDEVQRGEAA